jgi:hypothetical protein
MAWGSDSKGAGGLLITDFGFGLTSDDDGVRYDAAILYVEISSSKREIDLIFGVKVDTDTMRPYVSHVFSLAEVVRYYKTGPFPVFGSFPAIPGISEEERYVIYLATLTKKYCGDILRGDITALERLSLNRGAKHDDEREQ